MTNPKSRFCTFNQWGATLTPAGGVSNEHKKDVRRWCKTHRRGAADTVNNLASWRHLVDIMVRRRLAFKPTGVDDRARIVLMWADGVSPRDIAQEAETSVSTVYRWIRRWRKEGNVHSRRCRCLLGVVPGELDPVDVQTNSSPLPVSLADIAKTLKVYYRPDTLRHGFSGREGNCCMPTFTDCMDLRNINHDVPYSLGYTNLSPDSRRYVSRNESRNLFPVHPRAQWCWRLTPQHPI
ncbi:uncharacterized protein [Panulirus ornatus]|uniref:uncharacterized protein n=1 Tax=Panulirus ornatus TaxID=150431 RepID=UPI003A852136